MDEDEDEGNGIRRYLFPQNHQIELKEHSFYSVSVNQAWKIIQMLWLNLLGYWIQ